MDDGPQEFLEMVKQVRTHLEYQRALGVDFVELPFRDDRVQQRNAPRDANLPISPVVKKEVKVPVQPKEAEGEFTPAHSAALDAVREELGDCTRCKLHRGRKTIVFGEGNPNAALVFVGEGPGYDEDLQGRPFVGAAGQLLTDIIVKGMRLRRQDVYICNIVKCRPPNNRNPEPDEIGACEPFLVKQLEAIKPKIIIGLGNVAVKTLLKTKEGITSLRGIWKTYEGIPLMPTFHPAYLLRNPADKRLVWDDIKKVMAEMERIGKG